MESATVLAIIILIIALLILIYYYLQSVNHPVYQRMQAQATGISHRIAHEEYVSDLFEKIRDKMQDQNKDDNEEHTSKTDMMSKKIDHFINDQSEQIISDWNLATHKDLDEILDKLGVIEDDFRNYKESNDKRVESLEERVDRINSELKEIKVDEVLE